VESIIGQKLLDRDGEAIGKITDLIFDATTLEPDWVTVKIGRFGSEHLVPVSAFERSDVPTVPFPKEQVKEAPVIDKGHAAPSPSERQSILEHYGMEEPTPQ
jgi:sporulation protein YlmC with PRC-barrel domain